MTRPSTEQIDFVKRLSLRQRRILRALAECPHFMSASEIHDPEVVALFGAKLVRSHPTNPETSGPWLWSATDAGKALSRKIQAGAL